MITEEGPDLGLRAKNGSGELLIEGSKHVSGGTGPEDYVPGDPNGPPHVDEDVTFDFDPGFNVLASSVEVLLSDFELTDIIELSVALTDDATFLERLHLGTGDTGIFEQVGVDSDKLWKVKFSGLAGLSDLALIDNFTIRANDDFWDKNGVSLAKGTAEHFFITGLTVEASPVPIPGAIYLLGSGLIGLAGIRRKFRK